MTGQQWLIVATTHHSSQPVLRYRTHGRWDDYDTAVAHPSEAHARAALHGLLGPHPTSRLEVAERLPADGDGHPVQDGARATACCAALPTFSDDELCCKSCWRTVPASLLNDPSPVLSGVADITDGPDCDGWHGEEFCTDPAHASVGNLGLKL